MKLVVSLHDVYPGSLPIIREQIKDLEQAGVGRFSLLVVPYFHRKKRLQDDVETLKFLDERAGKGDELVLHGHYHQCGDGALANLFWTKLYTSNEAEFLDLSEGEALHRISLGKEFWQERGWPLHGFIAPAWLMPERQNALLKRMGFLYTNRLRTLTHLQKGTVTQSQSLCYSTRALWRRSLSLMWNKILFSALSGNPLLRLSLHPGDWEHAAVRGQILEIARMALAKSRQPVTYASYVQV